MKRVINVKEKTLINNSLREKRKFHCNYCGHDFEQYVGETTGKGKRNNVSNHVICPMCFNILPTWKEKQRAKEYRRKQK
jgi:hypothetical protein